MKWLALSIACVVAACGSDSSGPTITSIEGQWSFSGNFSNAFLTASCQFGGGATLHQNGGAVNGNYSASETCTVGGAIGSADFQGTLSGGQLNGPVLTIYDDGGCRFEGIVSSNQIAGPMTCTLALSGTEYVFSGRWLATR